jgi:chemotaxis protein methyltransferase CheR
MTERTLSPLDCRAAAAVREPTDREFEAFRELIRRQTGIHLNASKRALLYGRLSRRVRELGLSSFGDYLNRILDDDAERERMVDRITTNETRFFREPTHFAYLESTLLPTLVHAAAAGSRTKDVRAWSAGCSTGEEPYSMAMALLDRLPSAEGWNVHVVATDISTRVLELARQATWPIERAREIPAHLLRRFMLRGIGGQAGKLRASPELRRVVSVERLNLSDEAYSVGGPFDIVFCRNVLIYFDHEHKRRVIERLAAQLTRGGHLFVGHAESIQGATELSCARPTVYSKRDRGSAGDSGRTKSRGESSRESA